MKCTECGTEIAEDSAYCRMCGTKLGEPVCGNCQNTVSPDAEYCENCGTKFKTGGSSSKQKQGKSNQRTDSVGNKTTSSSGLGGRAAFGLILFVVSVVVAINAHQGMAELQTTGGQVLRALSEQQQQRYNSLSTQRTGGIIGAVIGIVLIISDLS